MTVSKALNKLVSKELVSRSEHKTDTRAKAVLLTTKGKNLIHRLIPIVEKLDEDFFNKISNQEKSVLINSFKGKLLIMKNKIISTALLVQVLNMVYDLCFN